MENNQTIEMRQDTDKKLVLEALFEMPIVQIACKKAGVSRSTYYRWRKEDGAFSKRSDDAIAQGIAFINDISESQLITLIKEKKMLAIALWLKHNHPRFKSQTNAYRVPASHSADDLSPQEKEIFVSALEMTSLHRASSSPKKP